MENFNAEEIRKICMSSVEDKYKKEINKIIECIESNASKMIFHYDYRISCENVEIMESNEKLQILSDYFRCKGFKVDPLDIINDEEISVGIRIKIT